MKIFSNDSRDPIEYNPVFREYFIHLNNYPNIITLAYCPWCGNKFPDSLREKYFDTLKKEHGIDTNLGEYKECSDIPTDFKSDKWWRVREISEEVNCWICGEEFESGETFIRTLKKGTYNFCHVSCWKEPKEHGWMA